MKACTLSVGYSGGWGRRNSPALSLEAAWVALKDSMAKQKVQKKKKKEYHSFPCYCPTPENSGRIIVEAFLPENRDAGYKQTERRKQNTKKKAPGWLSYTQDSMCSTGSFWETCFSTVHVKTWTDVPARPQARHSRITAVQGVPTPSQGPYRLSHALTGAWTYRLTPCPHRATALQDVTESSQGHSSTGCHHSLAR